MRESVNDLCLFMTWCRPDYSLADARAFIAKSNSDWEKGEQYDFAVLSARDEILLGSVGLNRINRANRSANIGYWVRRTRTRRGVATAALRLVAEFGLKNLGLQRLEILVPGHNWASRRVAERAGAKFEGVLRNRVVLTNKLHDARLYSLIPGDLPGLKIRAPVRDTIENMPPLQSNQKRLEEPPGRPKHPAIMNLSNREPPPMREHL